MQLSIYSLTIIIKQLQVKTPKLITILLPYCEMRNINGFGILIVLRGLISKKFTENTT